MKLFHKASQIFFIFFRNLSNEPIGNICISEDEAN